MATAAGSESRTPFYDPEVARDISAAVAGQTVVGWFAATVAARPDGVALRTDDGASAPVEITWSQYAQRALCVAGALTRAGIARGDRVALMLRNRPEFHLADMGSLLAGATPFSIYNSSPPEQIAYLLAHSRARVAILEDAEMLARLQVVRAQLPALEQVFTVEPSDAQPFQELLESPPAELADAVAAVRPDDIATLVYTSGTTGPPKAALTAHDRICWMLERFAQALDLDLAGKRIISYLPMAHILERDVSHWLATRDGAEVTTCPDPTQIGAHLQRVRPHFFAAVPRVWEKLAGAVRRMDDAPEPAAVRALLGLDRCQAAFSGGAPLPGDVLELFVSLGVPLGEGWGMTESTFVPTYDHRAPKPRAVGRILPGIELRIADDGEVLCRGPFVFRGYLDDEAKTAEAIDAEGWLHTGDVGVLDDEGYLRIVDRKKELIITAGGKNVAPSNLEAALKAHPLIGQACVIGDERPYLVALIVLDPEVAPGWARARGVESADLHTDPLVHGRDRRRGGRAERHRLAGRAHQARRGAGRRVAARLRGAHADDEAQAARHPRQARRRHRRRLRRRSGGVHRGGRAHRARRLTRPVLSRRGRPGPRPGS